MQSEQRIPEIEGISNGFNVKLRLTLAQKLEIYLQNRENYELYSVTVKPEQIKRDNIKNSFDLIQTASQLFHHIQFSLADQVSFEEIVRIQSKGKVTIKLPVKIDFRQGSKRKIIVYEFQAIKQSMNALDKLRAQVINLTSELQKLEKSSSKRMEEMEQQNKKLKHQLQLLSIRSSVNLIDIEREENSLIKFATFREQLIVRNATILQTSNRLNIVLIGEPFNGQRKQQWKVRVCSKMALIFGAGTPTLIDLQDTNLQQSLAKQKLLIKQYFNGGQIITCTFEDGEIKYVIEKMDIEDFEDSTPQPSYNLRRGSFMVKKLQRIDQLYPCFGLHLGARLEILNIKK